MNNRGVFFSFDAFIALSIIFLSVLIIYPIIYEERSENFIQDDLIEVLSSMKIGETNNSYIEYLIANGNITDLNKSVLEQIGEFYVSDIDVAKNLTSEIISDIDSKENIGIWYGSTLLASRNVTPFEDASSAEIGRQYISGIQSGDAVTGFSARAFFSSTYQTKYFYFGGYVGEGNLSAIINYSGNITNASMELAINNDFEVFINNIYSGNYTKSPSSVLPKTYSLPIDNFVSGENIIELRGDLLNIAGGYIKIIYDRDVQYFVNSKYNFPGIDGVINLYDGFYVPGNLSAMEIFLHFNSTKPIFLSIGNVKIFDNSTYDEINLTLNNSYLSSILDYNEISKKTVPLRFGMENASYVFNLTKSADVFSVTDLSGSMGVSCDGAGWWCCWTNDCDIQEVCESTCGGSYENKIDEAKSANNLFIDSILNEIGNRIGLVGYRNYASSEDFHPLSMDNTSLHNKVDGWTEGGMTCICCGINKAVDSLLQNSTFNNFRSIVVMSDGEANEECSEQGTGNPKQDAINAACDAYNNHEIITYAVGFGSDVDEVTLEAIADCGNGEYFFSNISELGQIYEQIAQDIIDASYYQQTLNLTGTYRSRLYPDSYIFFNYTKEDEPFGLITAHEKMFVDEYSANFSIPENFTIVESRVVSYSGPRWTNEIKINNNSIFNLTEYDDTYLELGDPYSINIPNSYVQNYNDIFLTTGLSPVNSTGGSLANKIIYYLAKQFIGYSSISSSVGGCTWYIDFEDDSNLTLNIPADYYGSEVCYYQDSREEYNSNDAIQQAVYELLRTMDFDNDGKLDVKFDEQNFIVSTSEIFGIPYDWSTEVQVRKWN
jgi:hypothetical protein